MIDGALLSEKEIKINQKLFTMWGQSCQDIMTTVVNNTVKITECNVAPLKYDEFMTKYAGIQSVLMELTFSGAVLGAGFIILKKEDASVIIDLIIGGDGTQVIEDFGDLHISIFSETTGQLVNSLIGIITNNTDKKVNILTRETKINDLTSVPDENLVELTYKLEIEGKLQGSFLVILQTGVSKGIASILGGEEDKDEGGAQGEGEVGRDSHFPHAEGVPGLTSPAVFPQLPVDKDKSKGENLDLILDITISIQAVLGESELTIRDLIELKPGHTFELNKLAGEPVDLVINDRLVAHGEVVVIEEKFGIKVTDVLSKAQRIFNLR